MADELAYTFVANSWIPQSDNPFGCTSGHDLASGVWHRVSSVYRPFLSILTHRHRERTHSPSPLPIQHRHSHPPCSDQCSVVGYLDWAPVRPRSTMSGPEHPRTGGKGISPKQGNARSRDVDQRGKVKGPLHPKHEVTKRGWSGRMRL